MVAQQPRLPNRFEGELEGFRALALNMGEIVQAQVQKAVAALSHADIAQACLVQTREKRIDQFDLEAQERAIELLAMHHPVARDLRFIVAISRTITDLERVGDEAAVIADLVVDHYEHNGRLVDLLLFDAAEALMTEAADMLARSLDAVEADDVECAIAVIHRTGRLAGHFDAAVRRLATYVMEDARNIKAMLDALIALKALERVGAHATNIAENVILYVTGKDVRHIKADHLSQDYLAPG